MTLYVFHARKVKAPPLDFRLTRYPTFHAALIGGFLFRLGIGAIPFLLPLMLQIGFGMTPFQSGLVTFADRRRRARHEDGRRPHHRHASVSGRC